MPGVPRELFFSTAPAAAVRGSRDPVRVRARGRRHVGTIGIAAAREARRAGRVRVPVHGARDVHRAQAGLFFGRDASSRSCSIACRAHRSSRSSGRRGWQELVRARRPVLGARRPVATIMLRPGPAPLASLAAHIATAIGAPVTANQLRDHPNVVGFSSCGSHGRRVCRRSVRGAVHAVIGPTRAERVRGGAAARRGGEPIGSAWWSRCATTLSSRRPAHRAALDRSTLQILTTPLPDNRIGS